MKDKTGTPNNCSHKDESNCSSLKLYKIGKDIAMRVLGRRHCFWLRKEGLLSGGDSILGLEGIEFDYILLTMNLGTWSERISQKTDGKLKGTYRKP